MDKKEVLIFAGIAVAAVLIFLYLKKQSQNSTAYLNEPGLDSQPGIGQVAQSAGANAVGQIISTSGNALAGLFGNAISSIGGGFSSQSSGGSNDPGLENNDTYEQDYESDNGDFVGDSTDYGGTDTGVDYFSSDDSEDAYSFATA